MKKKLSLLLAVPTLLLGACASSGSSDSDSINVIFWHTFSQSATAAIETLGEQFSELIKEQEGVDVTITFESQGSYDDILNKITTGLSVGNIPTMAIAYPDHVANYLATGTSYVYNLEDYMNDEEIGFGKESFLGDGSGEAADDFVEAFAEEGTKYAVEGTYSLPFMKSTEVMFYNSEAVDIGMTTYAGAEGYSTPAAFVESLDWDELLDFGRHCMEQKVLSGLEHAIWYDSDSNLFISKMYQQDIGYSSIVDGAGHIDFESGDDRTEAEAFVTELKEAYDEGVLTTKDTEGEYGSTAFKNEEVIFEIGSSGGSGYNFPSAGEFVAGVAPVPASYGEDGELNPLYITQGPTLTFLRSSALSDEVNAARMRMAWRFAKYITNPTQNVYMCVYGSEGYVPVRYSAYETGTYSQYLTGSTLQAKSANVVINKINGKYFNAAVFKGSAELRDECGGIITQVFKGLKDVTTAFNDAISTAKTNF